MVFLYSQGREVISFTIGAKSLSADSATPWGTAVVQASEVPSYSKGIKMNRNLAPSTGGLG